MPRDPYAVGVAGTARRSAPSASVAALGRGSRSRAVARGEGASAAAGVVAQGGGPAPGRPLLHFDMGFAVWAVLGAPAAPGEQHDSGGTSPPTGKGTRA